MTRSSLPRPILAALLLLAGCSPKYYAPNTENVPLLQQKGEGSASVLASEDRVEIQGAYAFGPAIAGMVNIGFHDVKDDEQGDGGEGSFLEGGPGIYRELRPGLVLEAYALAGYGEVENHFPSTLDQHPETTGKIEAKLLRLAVQPSIGFKSRFFDAAVSSRLAFLHYYDITGDLIFEEEGQAEYLERNRDLVLFEPALTLRGGIKVVKLELQWVPSLNLTEPDFRQEEAALTLGLHVARDLTERP